MKVLLIGGTGTISQAVAQSAAQAGFSVTVLNRGNHPELLPETVTALCVDYRDEDELSQILKGKSFDIIVDFLVFQPEQARRAVRLFTGRCAQYVFVSSASVYQKPVRTLPISEGTPLGNPYWQYARDKIACEEVFLQAWRDARFPVTIVRPSHTYGPRAVPVSVHGKQTSWQVCKRMLEEKPVIVHGDGLTLWTLTWNEDFAQGLCGLLGNPLAVGEAIHITSDEAVSWNTVYECIARALGVTPHLVHIPSEFLSAFDPGLLGTLLGDKANCAVFDNSKIKRLCPGFCAPTRFFEGASRCVQTILADPGLQKEDPAFDGWCDRVIEAHFAGLRYPQK